MKTLLQICLMLLVLLAHTVPLLAMHGPTEAKCTMGCCEGLADCGCAATPAKDRDPAPAQLPPTSSGRDFVPQVVWTELPQQFQRFTFSKTDTGRTIRPGDDEQTGTMPHVRLTVLFCSFLN